MLYPTKFLEAEHDADNFLFNADRRVLIHVSCNLLMCSFVDCFHCPSIFDSLWIILKFIYIKLKNSICHQVVQIYLAGRFGCWRRKTFPRASIHVFCSRIHFQARFTHLIWQEWTCVGELLWPVAFDQDQFQTYHDASSHFHPSFLTLTVPTSLFLQVDSISLPNESLHSWISCHRFLCPPPMLIYVSSAFALIPTTCLSLARTYDLFSRSISRNRHSSPFRCRMISCLHFDSYFYLG